MVIVLINIALFCQGICAETQQQPYMVHMESFNGTKESSCWNGRMKLPCESLERTLEKRDYTMDSVITVLSSTDQSYSSKLNDCSTWMHHANDTSECICGVNHHHTVKCNSTLNEISILDCYQMTFDEQLEQVVVGPSIYGCDYNHHDKSKVYRPVPRNKSQINEVMCGPFNRSGRLCGACKDGHSPLVYSYSLNCRQYSKSKSRYNWAKFIAMAFIPLTIFYILVLVVQFNANSPSLHGFVLVAQIISTPDLIKICMATSNERVTHAVKVIATIYGIWNLDFFRAFSPDICLNISTLQALALDYVIAFYPLLLILLTYVCMKLYSKDYKIFVWLWRPFHQWYVWIKRKQSSKTSIIDVFATFLLLSYNKIQTVCFDLLSFTSPANSTGHTTGTFLFYDPSYKYFGKSHLPYAVLGLAIFICFNLVPFLLLLVYPMKWFHKCLNFLKLNHIALHTFVDSFAGCYKDGTEPGTRDCRYFAALFLLLRIIICICYEITFNIYFFGLCGTILAVFTMALIAAQPYKKSTYKKYNTVTPLMFIMITLSVFSFININIALIKTYNTVIFSVIITLIAASLPQLYILYILLLWLCKFRKVNSAHYEQVTAFPPSSESSSLIKTYDCSLCQYQSI